MMTDLAPRFRPGSIKPSWPEFCARQDRRASGIMSTVHPELDIVALMQAELKRRGVAKETLQEATYAFLKGFKAGMRPGRRCRDIINQVAEDYGLRAFDLMCSDRRRKIIIPRHEAYYRCATELTVSYPQIGKAFGNRDHTTIIHGVSQHAKRNGLHDPTGRADREAAE